MYNLEPTQTRALMRYMFLQIADSYRLIMDPLAGFQVDLHWQQDTVILRLTKIVFHRPGKVPYEHQTFSAPCRSIRTLLNTLKAAPPLKAGVQIVKFDDVP
jgi:hypothetical protein